jgi:hypothetical protein
MVRLLEGNENTYQDTPVMVNILSYAQSKHKRYWHKAMVGKYPGQLL